MHAQTTTPGTAAVIGTATYSPEDNKLRLYPLHRLATEDYDLLKAAGFLAPGGVLVALCAAGPRQHDQLQPMADYWEVLPAGTFKEQGTGVNVALLTIKG